MRVLNKYFFRSKIKIIVKVVMAFTKPIISTKESFTYSKSARLIAYMQAMLIALLSKSKLAFTVGNNETDM